MQVEVDNLSVSECDDHDDSQSTQENLEEIVSHLLQHNLHLQQLLLSKQRRGLMSRKKFVGNERTYETSDTENDDLISHDSGLPVNSVNSLNVNSVNSLNSIGNMGSDATLSPTHDRDGDFGSSSMLDGIGVSDAGVRGSGSPSCIGPYFSDEKVRKEINNVTSNSSKTETAVTTASSDAGSSSECTSVYGSAISIRKQQQQLANSGKVKSGTSPSSHGMFDFGARRRNCGKKSTSNAESIFNVWSSLRSPAIKKQAGSGQIASKRGGSPLLEHDSKGSLRRAQSFNSELTVDKIEEDRVSIASSGTLLQDNVSQSDFKDRRATIAVYNSSCTEESLQAEVNIPPSIDEPKENGTGSNQDCPNYGIHPEHKIYTKAILSKNSLKNVINKLTSTRKHSPLQEAEEITPSATCSDSEKILDKTPSKLVYTMAKHCHKSLKERIKQIRSEDEDLSTPSLPVEKIIPPKVEKSGKQIYDLPQYQQGSKTIGAKLASNTEACEYQVPNVKIGASCEYQVPNVRLGTSEDQSSCPLATPEANDDEANDDATKASSSESLFHGATLDDLNLDDSSGSLEEFEDNSGGDSYYERSFEVIEDMLENDLFRDSAIYSDPEDVDAKANPVDLRNFPRSVLGRVSKSPSMRSDRYKMAGESGIVRKRSIQNTSDSNGIQAVSEPCKIDLKFKTSLTNTSFESKDVSQTSEEACENTEKKYVVKICPVSVETDKILSSPVEASTNSTEKLKNDHRIVLSVHGSEDNDVISTSHHNVSDSTSKSTPSQSPSKKVPPPVPAKPENVKVKGNRNYGSKIMKQLKNLEESSKYSKSYNPDVNFDGLKSINQRRKELMDESSGSNPSEKTPAEASASNSNQRSVCKPPKSPLLTVRAFVTKNISNSRMSRSTEPSVSASSGTKRLGSNGTCSSSQDESSSSDSSENKLNETFTKSVVVHNVNLSRRKSIKSLCSYVTKINSRSSSVPPRLSRRSEKRQSSLPLNTSTPSDEEQKSFEDCPVSDQPGNSSGIPSSKSYPEAIARDQSSSSEEGGVVIEARRPKGWVRHVVGRLQQVERASEGAKV